MEFFDITGKKILMPENADAKLFSELAAAYVPVGTPMITASLKDNAVIIGNGEKTELGTAEFGINVTKNGVYIAGKDYSSLVRGFFSFSEALKPSDDGKSCLAECGISYGNPRVKFRCLHLCLFPETDLNYIVKRVRTAAILGYTHVVIEFWGTLKFDCMPELGWKNAYTKSQIRPVIKEAQTLGLEVIPMFNHLGHAAGTSESVGKHVVLDQNPKYGYMFSDCGWEWRTELDAVRKLHASVRRELIGLCGEGEYFHVGCDEAYTIGEDKERAKACAEYINSVRDELSHEGRRVIMWGDMLLSRNRHKPAPPEFYCANSTEEVAEVFKNTLDKKILVADWQYDVKERVWSTTEDIMSAGFDVVCCPWYDQGNIRSAVDTALKTGAFGVMHTTWHSEGNAYCGEVLAGELMYGGEKTGSTLRHRAAELGRKALPSNGDYGKSGFYEKFKLIY